MNTLDRDYKKYPIGQTLLMQLIFLPSIIDYWTSKEAYGQESVKSVSPRKRYFDILRFLHISDQSSPSAKRSSKSYDKLHKICKMANLLNVVFRDAAVEGKIKSVDEAMTRFKGRHSLKQFNRDKPIKRGFKV